MNNLMRQENVSEVKKYIIMAIGVCACVCVCVFYC